MDEHGNSNNTVGQGTEIISLIKEGCPYLFYCILIYLRVQLGKILRGKSEENEILNYWKEVQYL